MITQEEFDKRAKRFVNAGYMKEIYKNDLLAIYNFGDAVYLVCPYFTDGKGDIFGMMMPRDLVQDIVNDNLLLSSLYEASCKDGSINQRVITLNDLSFNKCVEGIRVLREFYKDSVVNYEFEKALNDYQNKAKGL